jgi:hypothetical protein
MTALKQWETKPSLKLLYPAAQRRLRDRAAFRRAAEMAPIGKGAQKAKLLKAGKRYHSIVQ